jgi:hypothetical protein
MFRCLYLLFPVLIVCAAPALAESPYKGGMNYTTVGAKKVAIPQVPSNSALKQKTMDRAAPDDSAAIEETAASKVWTKYKALAAGTAHNDPPPVTGQQPAAKAAPAAPKATGIAALIQSYQHNKTRQSQMRTISVERPSAPDKPVVKEP